jgi:hypothetical protein
MTREFHEFLLLPALVGFLGNDVFIYLLFIILIYKYKQHPCTVM